MDKPRSKRPPDVNEALSSMLWTPYDETANTSSSSANALTDDERQRGERKLNRYSNPLPNSLNWWNSSHISNSQPMALRYSFPYCGNYLPTSDNFSSTTTTKRTISTTIDVGNHGQTINTSTFSTTMVHSFTDDFYQYQNQTTQNHSNCQSSHKYHKSQPSLPYDFLLNPSLNERINSHLVSTPTNISTTITTSAPDDKLFNRQRNNVRNIQANKWQQHEKVGNAGDLNSNSYVHEDSNKKHVRTCTNTTLGAEGKSKKVTQPPNVSQSYTLSRKCNERRGNKQNEHESSSSIQTQAQSEMKTLVSDGGGMAAVTKQISHNRDSNENAAECFVSDFYRGNRHDVGGEEYRLFQNGITSARMERVHVKSGDENYGVFATLPQQQTPPTTISSELHNRDLCENSQMPSPTSLLYAQSQHFPVALTHNVPDPRYFDGATNTSSVLFCKNNNQPRKNVTCIDMDSMNKTDKNDVKCNVDVNNLENDQNCVNVLECNNHVTVLMSNENDLANSNVKSFQSADKSSSEATRGPIIKADNLIITSAIENLSMAAVITSGTPSKAKYSNDIVTVREKRRRDRRDRRLARTRATNGASLASSTNEILPDIINNHLPPPYADMPPPQEIVPSVVSTVPVVEDNRYTFSLPLVRRSASDRSGKDCCGQWFNGPPLRFLVILVALGGVACTLGGATLGSIALAGSPTSHLTAGLLMTGVGIVLVTISGVAWRMTTSDAHQCTGRCGRRQCARGNSSFGLLYPEFQHRPPPPSYQASHQAMLQESRLREIILNRERQASNARASPPPTYRFRNAGTLLRPTMLFQRQGCATNNVQDENSIERNSSTTSDCFEHQSPTSSQTITTIASINRSNDNEFTLTSASHEASVDMTSLIKADVGGHGKRQNDGNVVNHISHENLNCNVSRNSSRCTTETRSDRNINCNKDSVSITDHNTDVIHCKNVNISNTKELNKALIPLTHLSPSSRESRDGKTFSNGARCEMGVR